MFRMRQAINDGALHAGWALIGIEIAEHVKDADDVQSGEL